MPKAVWNNTIIAEAEADHCKTVDGALYFPMSALKKGHFSTSDKTAYCRWKGEARYYDIRANGELNLAAAWYYTDPKNEFSHIKHYVTFWHDVTIEE